MYVNELKPNAEQIILQLVTYMNQLSMISQTLVFHKYR